MILWTIKQRHVRTKTKVMQLYHQYLTILLTISFFLTIYFIDYSNNTNGEKFDFRDFSANPAPPPLQMKTVVAYSFLKQIENEHLEVACPNLLKQTPPGRIETLPTLTNRVWTNIRNTSAYIYAAYPDHRVKSFIYARFIAVLKDDWNQSLYCQFHATTSIKVIRASRTNIWSKSWRNPDRMMPVLYSCPISESLFKSAALRSVVLTSNPCQLNSGGVKYNFNSDRPKTRLFKIMVCVKPLKFSLENIFDRLIWWIEMNSLLGVEEFDVYVNSVSKKVMKLLKWYRDVRRNVNILTYVNPWTFTSGHVNNVTALWRKRKNELIAYNDCFYRNIHKTNFVIPLDLDELIVPKIHTNYKQLLGNITNSDRYSSLSVRNAFFFHKTNSHNFFDIILRAKFSPPYRSGKSFINTSNTLTVFNHYSLQSLYPGVSRTYFLNESLAQLNHYRQSCDMTLLPADCNRIMNSSPVFDDGILRFEEHFLRRYNNVNKELKLANIF